MYELYDLRYATRQAQRAEHFIEGDPHDGPMPMDYFVWLAKNDERAGVIDMGFTAESRGKRGRVLERDPIDSLALLGVGAADVTHFYENMESGRPFTTPLHIGEMLDAFDTPRAHPPTPQHIVPGHDPPVMQRYPAPRPELEGIVVRLDVAPRA